MSHGTTRTISAEGVARVEGEGSLRVVVSDGRVSDVSLDIFEPPRFFEAMLVGRHFSEAPDITARICGICPVAYQMSACLAMEDACGIEVSDAVASLRRLLYCGEWIQSHALHVCRTASAVSPGCPASCVAGVARTCNCETARYRAGKRVQETIIPTSPLSAATVKATFQGRALDPPADGVDSTPASGW